MKSQDELDVVQPNDTTIIKCSDCKKSLMILYEKEKSGTPLFKIRVDCGCGGSSFQKEIYGVMRFLPADGVQLKDKVDLPGGLIVFKTTRVKK